MAVSKLAAEDATDDLMKYALYPFVLDVADEIVHERRLVDGLRGKALWLDGGRIPCSPLRAWT